LLAYFVSLPAAQRPSHYTDTEAMAALAAARLEAWNNYWSLLREEHRK